MKQDNLVGIDVSAKELVVRIEKDGIQIPASFDNTLEGHKKLLKYILDDRHF